MRITLLVLNGAVVIVFAVVFVMTFAARELIERAAEAYVEDRTREFAEPALVRAEETLAKREVKLILGAERIASTQAEIDRFRETPLKAMVEWAGAADGNRAKSFGGKFADRLSGWKEKVQAYFDKVLKRAVTDFRIFSGTNVVAGLIAFFLAWRAPRGEMGKGLIAASGLLLTALLYESWYYIDSFSFFTILLNTYLGWWYPVFVALTFGRLFTEHMRDTKAKELEEEPS